LEIKVIKGKTVVFFTINLMKVGAEPTLRIYYRIY